ncbi:TetR/AcrR family transcriptional regulator [Furfurilactobacillus curtus]|uniref:TetR family transcriptional regulator n=1 Tax=Furfurilactobacillus curtus TaxID=1746200 RepID=A0ABQ5JND0_9LACO
MTGEHEAAKRQELLNRIMAVVTRNGFQRLTMNDLIKIMGVSRRTAYKYFDSKGAVFHAIVRDYLDYVESLPRPQLSGDDRSFLKEWQRLFDQSLTLARTISDVFLEDLRISDDADYRNLQDALNQQQRQAIDYFEAGVNRGLFQRYDWQILLLQDQLMIRGLINHDFLVRHSVDLTVVLTDYYRLKKQQLLLPDKVTLLNDQPVRLIIEYFVNEYQRTFL